MTILAQAAFAFGFAGFIANLVRPDPSKIRRYIVLAFMVAFVATGAAAFWEDRQRSLQLQEVSDALLQKLGNEAKSIDQLHEELLFLVDRTDLGKVSLEEVLGRLVRAKRVGHG